MSRNLTQNIHNIKKYYVSKYIEIAVFIQQYEIFMNDHQILN